MFILNLYFVVVINVVLLLKFSIKIFNNIYFFIYNYLVFFKYFIKIYCNSWIFSSFNEKSNFIKLWKFTYKINKISQIILRNSFLNRLNIVILITKNPSVQIIFTSQKREILFLNNFNSHILWNKSHHTENKFSNKRRTCLWLLREKSLARETKFNCSIRKKKLWVLNVKNIFFLI